MAITRAQQVRQMLEDGGRLGYRFGGGYQGSDADTGEGGASKGPSGGGGGGNDNGGNDGGGGNQNTGNAREDYITNYVSKSRIKGPKVIGLDGKETDSYRVLTPTQINNARKFKEEQDKKRSRTIFSNTGFNLFPIATTVLNKLSNSRLAKYNNLLQRNNYLRTLPPEQQVAILERLAEEEEIGTTNPMGIDRNIQRGMGTYDYMDPEKVDKGFLGTGIGAGKFVTDIEFGGKDAKDVINEVTDGGYDDYLDRNKTEDRDDRGDPFVPTVLKDDTEDKDDTNTGGLALRFRKDGGRINAMDGGMMSPEGGIMDLETGRQMYFLGKLVKKATRAVKKIAKSPIGKAAILGGAMYFGGGAGAGKLGSFFGKGSFNPLKALITTGPQTGMMGSSGLGNLLAKFGLAKEGALTTKGMFGLGGGLLALLPFLSEEEQQQLISSRGVSIDPGYIRDNPYTFASQVGSGSGMARAFSANGGIMRTGLKDGISLESILEGKIPPVKMPDPLERILKNMTAEERANFELMMKINASRMPKYKPDPNAIPPVPMPTYGPDGKRSFAEGGDVEPVAKKTMPLLDMGGKEMDLRDDGGFVPLGRMERADDVPARLSKNEFVFTADAVRNAGEGDVDKGAEVMYNMMKNLESGGEVSEESQGLSGAREMFQTSKRLEEVL